MTAKKAATKPTENPKLDALLERVEALQGAYERELEQAQHRGEAAVKQLAEVNEKLDLFTRAVTDVVRELRAAAAPPPAAAPATPAAAPASSAPVVPQPAQPDAPPAVGRFGLVQLSPEGGIVSYTAPTNLVLLGFALITKVPPARGPELVIGQTPHVLHAMLELGGARPAILHGYAPVERARLAAGETLQLLAPVASGNVHLYLQTEE